MAEAAGLLGLTAETPNQVLPITGALEHDPPALPEAYVSHQELSMSTTMRLEQINGFGLFRLRAVLSGHRDKLIDLADTNLWR